MSLWEALPFLLLTALLLAPASDAEEEEDRAINNSTVAGCATNELNASTTPKPPHSNHKGTGMAAMLGVGFLILLSPLLVVIGIFCTAELLFSMASYRANQRRRQHRRERNLRRRERGPEPQQEEEEERRLPPPTYESLELQQQQQQQQHQSHRQQPDQE